MYPFSLRESFLRMPSTTGFEGYKILLLQPLSCKMGSKKYGEMRIWKNKEVQID